jgi:hypothetical protein
MNIAQAILHLYPAAVVNVDFLVQHIDGVDRITVWSLKDADGNDVPQPTDEEIQAAWEAMQPTDADLLASAKAARKAEISAAVATKITSGYQSTVVLASTGKAHFYGTKPDDQINMSAEYAGMLGNPDQQTVNFRTQDELDFIVHTRDEFKQIAETIKARIKNYLGQGYAYYRQLDAAQTVDEVNAIIVEIVDPD